MSASRRALVVQHPYADLHGYQRVVTVMCGDRVRLSDDYNRGAAYFVRTGKVTGIDFQNQRVRVRRDHSIAEPRASVWVDATMVVESWQEDGGAR